MVPEAYVNGCRCVSLHRCILKPIGQYFTSIISPLVRKRIDKYKIGIHDDHV